MLVGEAGEACGVPGRLEAAWADVRRDMPLRERRQLGETRKVFKAIQPRQREETEGRGREREKASGRSFPCEKPTAFHFSVQVAEDFTEEFRLDDSGPAVTQTAGRETDPHRLAQRRKQIEYGKNTLAYERYRESVPVAKRRFSGKKPLDPVTPDVAILCSKRAFEGLVSR